MQVRTVIGTKTVTMSVRITVNCSFCARSFVAKFQPGSLTPRSDDLDGRLCCNDCAHDLCGRGHATGADLDECESEYGFPAGEMDDFDYEVWADSFAAQALVQS